MAPVETEGAHSIILFLAGGGSLTAQVTGSTHLSPQRFRPLRQSKSYLEPHQYVNEEH
jgi:hypothetical protein